MNSFYESGSTLSIDSSFTQETLVPKLRKMDLSVVVRMDVESKHIVNFELPSDISFPNLTYCTFGFESMLSDGSIRTSPLEAIDIDFASSFPKIREIFIYSCFKLSRVELFHGKTSKLSKLSISSSFNSFDAFSQTLNGIFAHCPQLTQLRVVFLNFEGSNDNHWAIPLELCPKVNDVSVYDSRAFSEVQIRSDAPRQLKRLFFKDNLGLKLIRIDPAVSIVGLLAINDFDEQTRLDAGSTTYSRCTNINTSTSCLVELNFNNVVFDHLVSLALLRPSVVNQTNHEELKGERDISNVEAFKLDKRVLDVLSDPSRYPNLKIILCEFMLDINSYIDCFDQLPNFDTLNLRDSSIYTPLEFVKPSQISSLTLGDGRYPSVKVANQEKLRKLTLNLLDECSVIEVSNCPNLDTIELFGIEQSCTLSVKSCPLLSTFRWERVDSIESVSFDESCTNLTDLFIENEKPFNMSIPDTALENLKFIHLGGIHELSGSFPNVQSLELTSESPFKRLELRNTRNLRELIVQGAPSAFSIDDTSMVSFVSTPKETEVHKVFQKLLEQNAYTNSLTKYLILDEPDDAGEVTETFFGGRLFQNGDEKRCYFEEEPQCPICLDQMTEECIILRCGHALHETCIRELLVDSACCPVCSKSAEARKFRLDAY
ncbi:BA75_02107T0 [Komagataella pastoris]|uniref:BA75_02107T0 n=1 Tax=Komagataella pastoris TaxID=4922 RepID=A0A1B2JAF9_PICPA|nr:BA75_02107T0 [Komagataella pastoris]